MNAHRAATAILTLALLTKLTSSALADPAIGFGGNAIYKDSDLINLGTAPSQRDFFDRSHVGFFRWPGGLVSRATSWDCPELMPTMATQYTALVTKMSSNAKEMLDLGTPPPKSFLRDFLTIAKTEGVSPIVVLNGWYYHDPRSNGQCPGTSGVHPIYAINSQGQVVIDPNIRWTDVLANIHAEMEAVHAVFPDRPIRVEISNEDDHVIPAKLYATVVAKYVQKLSVVYPNDRYMIQWGSTTSNEVSPTWDEDVLAKLNNLNALRFISDICPHLYRNYDTIVDTTNQAAIDSRFRGTGVTERIGQTNPILAKYPQYPIRIFATEFGLSSGIHHPNFNSQFNGLLMFAYLLELNSSANVEGAIRHTLSMESTGLFLTASSYQDLRENSLVGNLYSGQWAQPDEYYAYISPDAKAVKVFFEENRVKAHPFMETGESIYSISSPPDETLVNIVNYGSTSFVFSLKDRLPKCAGHTAVLKKYHFPNLDKKNWEPTAVVLSSDNDEQIIPAYTYATIRLSRCE